MGETTRIRVPDDFIAQVRDSNVAEDLELPDETVSLIAAYLYSYLNNEAAKDLLRRSQKEEHQRRLLKSLRNSTRTTETKLHTIMADPVLSRRLFEAYEGIGAAEVTYWKPGLGVHNLYVGQVDAPEDPESSFLQLRGQLSILVEVLDSLDPEPSPNTTNKATQEALFMLVNNLDKVVRPFVGADCTKTTRASYIKDCLSIVSNISAKTILNHLS